LDHALLGCAGSTGTRLRFAENGVVREARQNLGILFTGLCVEWVYDTCRYLLDLPSMLARPKEFRGILSPSGAIWTGLASRLANPLRRNWVSREGM